MLIFYNTLGGRKQEFKPLTAGEVKMYTCGPTVYNYAHIGNFRAYVFQDILRRYLKFKGLRVTQVMNITDVGHLTSDADEGEDKIEKAAKKERKNAWQIADFYTKSFKKDIESLNIKKPDKWVKATDTIKEQIEIIKVFISRPMIIHIFQ